MLNDEIIEEVRANREAHAAEFNYDLRAIYEDIKKSEAKHIQAGHPFVELPIVPISSDKQCSPTLMRRFRSAT